MQHCSSTHAAYLSLKRISGSEQELIQRHNGLQRTPGGVCL